MSNANRISLFSLIKSYIRFRRFSILFSIGTITVFSAILYSFDLPMNAIIYGVVILAMGSLIIMSLDIYGYSAKLRALELLGDFRDMTPFPKAENQIELAYQNQISHLTNLHHKHISTANTQLSELTDYYTIWAHQIKTPLTAIRLLVGDSDMESKNDMMGEILKTEEYVDAMLGYFRLGSPSTDYVFREYPLDEIIKKSIRKYAPIFIRKKIKIEYEPVEASLLTDEKWFSFMLDQILSNALKYTDNGSIRIYIKSPGCLCIEDRGMGIHSEDLPRIFEMGYTGYNGRIESKSTGIGLFLCKKIAKALSVDLSITSKVGIGTAVMVRF